MMLNYVDKRANYSPHQLQLIKQFGASLDEASITGIIPIINTNPIYGLFIKIMHQIYGDEIPIFFHSETGVLDLCNSTISHLLDKYLTA
jgi:hypothetical protein